MRREIRQSHCTLLRWDPRRRPRTSPGPGRDAGIGGKSPAQADAGSAAQDGAPGPR